MDQPNPTIVFPAPGRVVIEERTIPEPGPGQLVVKTACTLISTGTELTILKGGTAPDSRWAQYGTFPFVPGYNNVGQVVGVGEGVDAAWIGRRVGSYGAHAAYTCCSAAHVRTLPPEVNPDEAVFFTLAEIAMNGVRRGAVTWGEEAVVFGLGLVGQLTARFCHWAGACVVGVELSAQRRSLLPAAPRMCAIDPDQTDPSAYVREQTQGDMADVAFEVTGAPDAIAGQVATLRQQGRLVLVSSPRGATAQFDFHDLCNAPSISIIGAHNSSHPPHPAPGAFTQHRHADLFFRLIASGELDVAALISHRAPFAQAPSLYDLLLRDRTQAMGVLLQWSD